VFDPYIWAAAVAQATQYSAVLATSHIAVINPILAAKQCATIDHVSGGRFALNVVAGWNIPELEMFGRAIKGHDDRYEEADEWVGVLKRLWSSDELFDHTGGSFQLKQAISLPHPLQKPHPPIMNAGGSKRGMHFAAKNADLVFVVIKSEKPANIAAQVAEYRELARREYGREIQVWTFGSVIQRETLADAEAYERYFAIEHGDDAAADGFIRLNNLNSQLMVPEQMEQMRLRFKAGGGFPLQGNAQQIAARLEMLNAAGLDGVLLVWPEPYGIGIQKFGNEVLPLLEQAGLRDPFHGASADVGLQS
jgi:alkanesulfonate monooxygenase SsuD/methylene tetrahydromethanopterin reductase-like flavin-dependent oxidoreductase (luciferase family)